MEPTDTPIIVSESAVPTQVMAALRQLLVAAGGYLVGRGWLTGELVEALVPALLLLVPFAWSQLKVRRVQAKLVTAASAAPDSVAQVR